MGGSFSAFNKFGILGVTSATMRQIYDKHFKEMPTETFEDFHVAYVEFCKYLNTILPGQDFDTPSLKKFKEFYTEVWSKQSGEKKREAFFKYIEEHVTEAKVDDKLFIMTGLAAPAAAVIGKRASGHIPYVKNMRLDLIPNVVFVPVFTLGAIVVATAAQINRKSVEKTEREAAEQEEGDSTT